MSKIFNIVFFITLGVVVHSEADGPLFNVKDKITQQEFDNAYQDLKRLQVSKQNSIVVNVVDYGAKGDGVTNDASAISAAFGTGNRIVWVPAGRYLIGNTDGINITVSSTTLFCSQGAVLIRSGTQGAITLARASNTTITNVTIDGCYITSSDNSTPNSGIVIAPDSTNIASGVKIKNCIIDGMGQYGIVIPALSGGSDDLQISDTRIINNGSTSGTHTRQALILNPSSNGIQRLVISNVYAEERSNPPAGTAETDGAKIQFSSGAVITNFHVKGGGSNSITGNTLIFNQNSNLMATNILVEGTGGGGFQLDTSTAGVNIFTNVICTGTFSSNNGVILAANGSHHLHINGIYTDEQVIATAGSYHDNLIIENGVIRQGIRIENANTNNSTIRNIRQNSLTFLSGNYNTFDGNISSGSTGTGLRDTGYKNVFSNNKIYTPTSYCFQVNGDSNAFVGNYCDNPGSGFINVGSGTGNDIENNYGIVSITDSGTSTILPYISSVTSTNGVTVVTSGVFFDVISTFTLTPGAWDLGAALMWSANGATFTSTDFEGCIGTAAGSSATGCSDGQNYLYNSAVVPTTFSHFAFPQLHHRVNITTNTNYYLKGYIQVFTAGNPKVRGMLWARRA